MKKDTQRDKVLKHLQRKGNITSWNAIYLYGITRLSAIIYNLRDEGYNIVSETINTKNRYGEPIHFTKYILEK